MRQLAMNLMSPVISRGIYLTREKERNSRVGVSRADDLSVISRRVDTSRGRLSFVGFLYSLRYRRRRLRLYFLSPPMGVKPCKT